MKFITFLLFAFAHLFAEEEDLAVESYLSATMANDPSALIEGKVNAITGQPCLSSLDLTIQGVEPIRLTRFYIPKDTAEWNLVWDFANAYDVPDASYRWIVCERGEYPIIYKIEGSVKIGQEKFTRYVASKLNKGISNTSGGTISSRTNPLNHTILVDDKYKSFTVQRADGTIRSYKKVHHSETEYKLLSEHLPNGNWIFYEYQEFPIDKKSVKTLLSRIYTTSPSKDKVFASADFQYENPKESNGFKVFGSDGQTFGYCNTYDDDGEQRGPLGSVYSMQGVEERLEYVKYKNKAGEQQRLYKVHFPLERTFKFKYYSEDKESVAGKQIKLDDSSGIDLRRNRVKTLSDSHQISHSFIYDLYREYGKITSVYDCDGNVTEYHFGTDLRLWELKRYFKEKELLNFEKCLWGDEMLQWRAFYDGRGAALHFKRYIYDGLGNVVEEKFFGNLSGKGPPIALDSLGQPTESGECLTKRRRYSGGRPSLLLEEKEAFGKRTVYEYLTGTDLVSAQTSFDQEELICRKLFEYNEDHLLIKEIEEDGHIQKIRKITPLATGPYIGMPHILEDAYVENGVEHLLKKTVLTYTTGGRIAAQDVFDSENIFRYRLTASYDGKGRVKEQTNALGQMEKFSYDECGNRTLAQGVSGRAKIFNSYDRLNRKVEEHFRGDDGISLKSKFTYDGKHHLISETDPRGNVTSHSYDSQSRRIQTTLPQELSCKSEYDALGNEIVRVDQSGNVTKTSFNVYGSPTLIQHPDGAKEEFLYRLDGTLKTHIDPLGLATHYEYDGLGRTLSKKKSSKGRILSEEHFEYRGVRLTAKTDPEGNRTTYTYDGAGRKVKEECGGEKILYEYDSLGRINRIQRGEICQVTEYDLLDRVIEEREESRLGKIFRKVRYEYDAAGNRSATTLGCEGRREYRYDSLHRPIEKKDPLGALETFRYEDHFVDPTGKQVFQKVHKDPLGLETIETYDSLSRLSRIEKRKEKRLSLEEKSYTPTGHLSSEVDTIFAPDGSSREVHTRWRYDARGRVVALIEADGTLQGRTTHHSYTLRGSLSQTIKPNRTSLDYRYDELGNLLSLTSSDGSVHHAMVYDRLGRLKILDGMERTFDPQGRLLSEKFPSGFSLENAYDASGRRTACDISLIDCLIEYGYEGMNLETVTRKTGDGVPLFTHTYLDYDLSGNALREKLIGNQGLITSRFDLLDRKEMMEAPHFVQEVLEFDPVGNIKEMRIQNDLVSYEYDPLYQLTSEAGHEYLYDSLYNRLEKDREIYEINPLNQIVSHFEYDPNGNPIRQGDWHYSYDALDRLIQIETPECTIRFNYDFLHRCLSKTTLRGRKQTVQYFLYDGRNEIGSCDGNFQPLELRILGETPHGEIGAAVAFELHGKVYAPIHDLQGNVAALLPLDNGPVTHYRYSAFGEEKVDGPVESPWRFSSKRVDEETKLIQFGRRFYTPEFGRWMTPDPAGFTDGMNLYAFVHNDPLTHLDVYGLLDYGQLERSQVEGEIKKYLSGGYKFEDHYHHYVPDSWVQNRSTTKPPGEIVVFTGIRTTSVEHVGMLHYTSQLAGGLPVHGIRMPNFDLSDSLSICRETLKTGMNSTVLNGEKYFRDASERVGPDGGILAFGYSAGAMNAYFGAMRLPEEIRKKIIFRAISPAKIIPKADFHSVRNYRSSGFDALMTYHELVHRKEYDQAVSSGLLEILPVHPSQRWKHEHFYMSPTFQPLIRKNTNRFDDQFECR